ncbi:S8 family serine peptidase [uncultured Cytophaga sp.]|uniref:S8 family serine peptidase n=1 Tax=uncultured Cytophaga sp. TaxID=160238 RepID=UPI0026119969|nr:S8 family serine peptidase [uncultured Cytophaga sp.]
MVLRSRLIYTFLLLISSSYLICAQTNTYIIFLKDKQGSIGNVNTPENFLSARSILKKKSSGIPIDSMDLPVSEPYLNILKTEGAEIRYTSRWMNAVCIQATSASFNQITLLPFVQNSTTTFNRSAAKNTYTTELSLQSNNYASNYTDFLGINYMHDLGIKGKDVLITITDSGFPGVDTLTAFKHLWNNHQIIHTYDIADNENNIYNDDNHGTYMLSVLAADALNYKGIVPEADFILLRTEVAATESNLEEYNWLRAAEIADSCGADIISVSLGYTTYDNTIDSYTYNQMDGETSVIARAADIAYKKGMLVVCSAGNDGTNYWKYIGTPADAKHVLAVGSVDANNMKSSFSSFGPTADGRIKPDLCALGNSITCIKPNGDMFVTGGTSLATPMIAGMLAGMKQTFPTLSNELLKSLLLQSCDHYSNPNNSIGHGTPYFPRIFSFASIYTKESTFLIAPNPYQNGQLILKVPNSNEQYTIKIFDNQGRLVLNNTIIAQSNFIELKEWVVGFCEGMYFVSIDSPNDRETIKWVKL